MADAKVDGNGSVSHLSSLFEGGLKIHDELYDLPHPSNSKEFQDKVKEAIGLLEDATKLVNEIGLFSSNESIDEIATADVKYLLLPALLGSLTGKLVTNDRQEVIEVSEVYFTDLLQRCKTYGIVDVSLPERNNNEEKELHHNVPSKPLDFEVVCKQRQEKIEQYRRKKEIEKRLAKLKSIMESQNTDEEIVREFYLVSLTKWVAVALEEIASMKNEKPILSHISKVKTMKNKTASEVKRMPQKEKRLKPVIITKNEIQKKIFGLGYPSIPAMTIDEFYEERLGKHDNQNFSQTCSLQSAAENPEAAAEDKEKEAAAEEQKVEADDPEFLKYSREWDNWKDDNPHGSGNRKNMG